MELSPGQVVAYDKANAWLQEVRNSPAALKAKPFFYIGGYAGTGKSTIANKVTENVPNKLFGTFTGKAASVLQKKGVEAATIHSLIYALVPIREDYLRDLYKKKQSASATELVEISKKIKEELKPKFRLNDNSALLDTDLMIVDEVSMVNEEMGRDLLSFKVPILVLGDPGQLPPVSGEGFFTRGEPDVLLTEIHRQAAGNPIIAMASLARNGTKLKAGNWGGGNQVVWRQSFNDHTLPDFDQIICGRNATRKALNARVRDHLGYLGPIPNKDEKVICLKNNKDIGILNGTQWRVHEVEDSGPWIELSLFPEGDEYDPTNKKLPLLEVSAHPFDADFENMQWYDRKRFEEFDYGYAITCHKSQGSQWEQVLIQNESWCFRESASKWLYTALTRAEKSVTVVL
jgi:exodeoxyribonuclease-5